MKITSIFTVISLLIFSCGGTNKNQFEYAGGKITLSIENEPSTFISRDVTDVYSSNVLSQVMEGLVSLNPKDLKVQPQLAEKWEVSDDGLTYTFHLKHNVKFHPHRIFHSEAERVLIPLDVQKTLEYICSKGQIGTAGTAYSALFEKYLDGAKAYHEGKAETISGISIKRSSVTLKLTEKDNNFLNKLANISCAIISHHIIKENLEQDMIGTGPFLYREYIKDEVSSILLTKNKDYYLKDNSGKKLPYLDSIEYIIEPKKNDQLSLFKNKKIDLIRGLPASEITEMLEGRISDFNDTPPLLVLHNNPILTTHYYYFNMLDERFKDVRVRKAFNYAIDRKKIGSEILRNQYSELGNFGIVPPVENTFKGYDFEGIQNVGYKFNPEKARKLLAEAGFPNGKGFGNVNLRLNISDIHSAIADEVAQQLSTVLNINVNLDASTFGQLEKDGQSGNYELSRNGWAADYVSPETFLFNFYGKNVPKSNSEKSSINKSRYQNPLFDEFFEKAKKSSRITDQMKYFSQAEVELMKNPPIIPLWYKGDYGIVYSNVRNLYFNPLFLFNFTNVYKKEWTKEEFLKATKKSAN
jgi:oligopeptide transport system substrate-binding protein